MHRVLRTIGCMKTYLLAVLGTLMVLPLVGQESESTSTDTPRSAQRQRLIKRFDKDGDGKLNDEEKAAMQKFIEEHRKNGGERKRGERRGQHADHEALIKEFDKDEDGKLSPEERKAMREELARRRHSGEKRHSQTEKE